MVDQLCTHVRQTHRSCSIIEGLVSDVHLIVSSVQEHLEGRHIEYDVFITILGDAVLVVLELEYLQFPGRG